MEELWRYWNQTALPATYEQAGEPADTAETPPQPAGPGPGLSNLPGLMELNKTAASPMDALITDRQMQQDLADAAAAQQAFPNYPGAPGAGEIPAGLYKELEHDR
jgi:hypothetical protein